MCMMGILPIAAVVPFALLLTLSFFVLFTLRKVEEKALRAFGYVVAGLLCFAGLVVFLGAPYNMSRVPVKMKYMMRQKMNMEGMPQMSRQGNMPEEQKPAMSQCSGNKGVMFKGK